VNQPPTASNVSLVWLPRSASAAQEPTTKSLDRRLGTTPRWPSAPGRRGSGGNASADESVSGSANRAADTGELVVVGEGAVVDGGGFEVEVDAEVEVGFAAAAVAVAAASGFRGFRGFRGFHWPMNGRTGSEACYCATAARGVAAGAAWGGSRGRSAEEEGSTRGGARGVAAGCGNTGSPSPRPRPALSLPRAGALENPFGREPPW
jgi:hypothetical protein